MFFFLPVSLRPPLVFFRLVLDRILSPLRSPVLDVNERPLILTVLFLCRSHNVF